MALFGEPTSSVDMRLITVSNRSGSHIAFVSVCKEREKADMIHSLLAAADIAAFFIAGQSVTFGGRLVSVDWYYPLNLLTS